MISGRYEVATLVRNQCDVTQNKCKNCLKSHRSRI